MKVPGSKSGFSAGMVLVAVMLLGSCAASGGTSTASGAGSTAAGATSAPPATVATPTNYGQPGPYKVGMMTITVGGTKAVVFYPADPSAVGNAVHVTSYSSGEAFGPELRSTVGSLVPEFVQDIPIDAYQDATISASGGPFPTIIHSHGFGGFYLYTSQHLAQEASWGFVVAAPDHLSRSLSAVAGGKITVDGDPDVVDLRATLAAVTAENARSGSPLRGGVDTSTVGAEGHSAGGRASYLFAASEPAVKAWIGQAPSAPVSFDQADMQLPEAEQLARQKAKLESAPPLDRPAMIVAGEKDSVIPIAGPQDEFAWLQPPKRMIVVANAGHASFIDVCKPIRDQGGLEKYATKLPAFAPLFKLGDDGCGAGNVDPTEAAQLINHVMIAQYRYVMGKDPTAAALSDPYLRATFPTAFGSQTAEG